MSQRSDLRLGIIGYGRLAQGYYTPALQRMRGVQVTCIGDPGDPAREMAARNFPRAVIGHSHEHVIEQAPDAVLVATPPSTHVQIWRAARQAGIFSFVEKPFALAAEVDGLPELSDNDAMMMVDFNRRFWPLYQQVGDLVQQGRIGILQQVDFTMHINSERWGGANHLPREGGVLFDLGSHAVDVVCGIVGAQPSAVRASRPLESPNAVRLDLDFPRDVRASCDLRHCNYNREALLAIGTSGRILLRNPNAAVHITSRTGSGGPVALVRDVAGLGYRFVFVGRRLLRYSIRRSLDTFVSCIREPRAFEPGYGAALQNTRLLAGAAAMLELAGGNPDLRARV